MDKGVAYIATGEKYIEEAVYSAQSCKTQNPKLDTTLLADREVNFSCFDTVKVQSNLRHNYGLLPEDFFPYEYTLFLDTDTRVCGDLSRIFDLLDVYDIGISESIGNLKDTIADHSVIEEEIPPSFPLFNSGVILYKKNEAVADLFSEWHDLYTKYRHQDGFHMNQPSFRVALYQSEIQFIPLSNIYNCRVPYHGAVNGEVKILHGRSAGDVRRLDQIAEHINRTSNRRVYTLETWPIKIRTESESFRYKIINNALRLRQSVNQDGIFDGGIKPVCRRLRNQLIK